MGYTILDERDVFLEVKLDEYWNVEEKYKLEIYGLRTSKKELNKKFNEMVEHFSHSETDYYLVEILISEMMNDGYTNDLFLSTSKERTNDFKIYIEYILKYNASKYDKSLIGSHLANFFNVTHSDFTNEEKINYLKGIAEFSNYNTNAAHDYLNEMAFQIKNQSEFETFIDNYIAFFGTNFTEIENSIFVLHKKFRTIYSEMEINDLKIGISHNLNMACNSVLFSNANKLYYKALKWIDLANKLSL